MIRKFDAKNFKWDGVDTLVYKQDGSPFKDVTRQVLYDGALIFHANSAILNACQVVILRLNIMNIHIWL